MGFPSLFRRNPFRLILNLWLVGDQVEDWHFHYAKASTALHDRVGMLRNAAGLVENSLVLLGASGIEDRLQVSFSLSLSWEVRDHICLI